MARKKTAIARRRGPSPKLARLETRIKNAAAKRRQEKKQVASDIAALAGGALLGVIERYDFENPLDIPGVDDAAVYAALAYGLGMFVPGNAGSYMRGAAVGMAAVSLKDLVAGD
jgi:hypothetical protein